MAILGNSCTKFRKMSKCIFKFLSVGNANSVLKFLKKMHDIHLAFQSYLMNYTFWTNTRQIMIWTFLKMLDESNKYRSTYLYSYRKVGQKSGSVILSIWKKKVQRPTSEQIRGIRKTVAGINKISMLLAKNKGRYFRCIRNHFPYSLWCWAVHLLLLYRYNLYDY